MMATREGRVTGNVSNRILLFGAQRAVSRPLELIQDGAETTFTMQLEICPLSRQSKALESLIDVQYQRLRRPGRLRPRREEPA
jgi:hypothetical protein